MDRMLPLPVSACRTEDLYDAFRHWCHKNGAKGPQLGVFVAEAVKRCRGTKDRRRHKTGDVTTRQSTIVFPQGSDPGASLADLSEAVDNFTESVKAWRKADGGAL
jgi:hypothetical protein